MHLGRMEKWVWARVYRGWDGGTDTFFRVVFAAASVNQERNMGDHPPSSDWRDKTARQARLRPTTARQARRRRSSHLCWAARCGVTRNCTRNGAETVQKQEGHQRSYRNWRSLPFVYRFDRFFEVIKYFFGVRLGSDGFGCPRCWNILCLDAESGSGDAKLASDASETQALGSGAGGIHCEWRRGAWHEMEWWSVRQSLGKKGGVAHRCILSVHPSMTPFSQVFLHFLSIQGR